jgi:N-acetylneuraminic acid mutarotase
MARAFHGFASAGGKLFVHGGKDARGNIYGDLHSFDPVAIAWNLATSVSGDQPTKRFNHGFTTAEGMLYIHGGCSGIDPRGNCMGLLDDLHSFEPITQVWKDLSNGVHRPGALPSARFSHGITSIHGTLFFHGGQDVNNKLLSDLHSFDTFTEVWSEISAVSGTLPTARLGHGFTSAEGKLYVHGGCADINCYNLLQDLYVFDPADNVTVWKYLADGVQRTPPTPRYKHGLTSAGGRLYMYGGYSYDYKLSDGWSIVNDLHMFHSVAKVWTNLAVGVQGPLPTARLWHGFTSANNILYIHGGSSCYGICPLGDFLSFDTTTMFWIDLAYAASGTAPTARAAHGFTSAGGKLYVHGGQNKHYESLGDLHRYDPVGKVWTDLSAAAGGTTPAARSNHGFTSAYGTLYVHGGSDSYGDFLGDLHSFHPVAMVWKELSVSQGGSAPTARKFHGFTSANGNLYVHGGCAKHACPANDLHVFDPATEIWTDLSVAIGSSGTAPMARAFHCFTSAHGKLFVHGGQGSWDGARYPVFSTLHVFSPSDKKWTDLVAKNSPPARFGHGIASVAKEGRLYMHDGYGTAGCTQR